MADEGIGKTRKNRRVADARAVGLGPVLFVIVSDAKYFGGARDYGEQGDIAKRELGHTRRVGQASSKRRGEIGNARAAQIGQHSLGNHCPETGTTVLTEADIFHAVTSMGVANRKRRSATWRASTFLFETPH